MRVDISVYILLCTYCEPFSAKPHSTHERVSNSHQRNVHASRWRPPGGSWWRGRKGSRLVVGRGRGREKARSVACGEVGGGGVESSIFPIANFALRFFPPPELNTEPPPTRPHRQPPRHPTPPPISTPLNGGGGGGGGCSRVSPFRRAPCSILFRPRLTPTSHSFLHSLRRPGLALFFLPSAYDQPPPPRTPSPFTSPVPHPPRLSLASLSITICSSASTWRGPTDQTSGTADTIKTGKKATAAHTFRAVTLSLSHLLFFSLSRARDDELPDAFEKLFMKRPTRFLERVAYFFPSPRRNAQRSR